jgi:hypothetical protein
MKSSICFRIDGSVQPVLLVVDLNCLVIDRSAIRILTVSRL